MSKNHIPINPITRLDFPDPEIIRVGEVWYMVSTTMHFMPGGQILRSYDLVHWEHAAYVFDVLEDSPAHNLENGQNIYGKGMWAACLRHHAGRFYVCFSANDNKTTYLFTATSIEGPWKKQIIQGFYYDPSLLFDGDRVFIAWGNTEIKITELLNDLSRPKPGGLDRVALRETGNAILGYEGAHFYKLKGRYWLFLIHSRPDRWRRVQAAFSADSIDGEFIGGDIIDDDRGYCGQGVAQGGIVDAPDGSWYAFLFQDHGAVGRIPVLVPAQWRADQLELGQDGRIPADFPIPNTRPEYLYGELYGSDDFRGAANSPGSLRPIWQWNHRPDNSLWHIDMDRGALVLTSGALCPNLLQCRNVLTQRMRFPACSATIQVDGSGLKNGDFAGIAALQGHYGLIALVREADRFSVRMLRRATADGAPGEELGRVELKAPQVKLRIAVEFEGMRDQARFYIWQGEWRQIGPVHQLRFDLEHFAGCRFGLFYFSTVEVGGQARLSDFRYDGD